MSACSATPAAVSTSPTSSLPLPDVAHDAAALARPLDWVGMERIALPLRIAGEDGSVVQVAASVDVAVDLCDADARGIHMSRLYLQVEQALSTQPLSADMLHALLRGFLDSHKDLSDRACLSIRFEHLVRRPALKSANSGWRAYPVCIEASLAGDEFLLEFGTEVVYSSTCPASAALSRQLIQDQFASDFVAGQPLEHAAVLAWLGSEKGIVATAHAQRSVARLRVRPAAGAGFHLVGLIDRVEHALGTPVQTAVKREDEQAFALANGGNLMFCEDAARRIQKALDADDRLGDFHVRVEHQESLHPHDAVAYASKGVEGGYGSSV